MLAACRQVKEGRVANAEADIEQSGNFFHKASLLLGLKPVQAWGYLSKGNPAEVGLLISSVASGHADSAR
jgi:hypothetical protein